MAGSRALARSRSPSRLLVGFAAGFLATLVFHQAGILLLHLIGLIAALPYSLHPVPPFGVPRILSLAFWGGLWGIVFVLVEPGFARGRAEYWTSAILFGAILPSLVGWFVVRPLKGLPVAAAFAFPRVLIGPFVDGLWGLGTAVFLTLLSGPRRRFR